MIFFHFTFFLVDSKRFVNTRNLKKIERIKIINFLKFSVSRVVC